MMLDDAMGAYSFHSYGYQVVVLNRTPDRKSMETVCLHGQADAEATRLEGETKAQAIKVR